MTAIEQLDAAQNKLAELTRELEATRDRAGKLAVAANLPELARLKLAGGALYLQAGNLGQLQAAQLEVEVLGHAIAIQQLRVEQCESFAARAEITALRRQRDTLGQQINDQLQQLSELFEQLDQVQQMTRQLGDEPSAVVRLPDPLQRIATQLVETWRQTPPQRDAA